MLGAFSWWEMMCTAGIRFQSFQGPPQGDGGGGSSLLELSSPLLLGGGDFCAHGAPHTHPPGPSLEQAALKSLSLWLLEALVSVQAKSLCSYPPEIALWG